MSTFDQLTGRLPLQSLLHRRYRLLALAGRGGMSAVYKGIDTLQGDRSVAIKEMSQGRLDDAERREAIARFQQEYQLLHKLQHPNLPQIYETFEEQDRFYFVMDFIEGKTLLDLLQDNGGRPLPVAQVIEYAIQLCDVLSYLHSRNPPIIFRDLKPTNVMVRTDGQVMLIDFGIARLFKVGKQHDTILLGSPGYAPPEQHGSGQTGPRSDVYALGATLHCCLTARDPFNAPDRFNFPPIRQYNPQVSVELEQLILRMLARDATQRPNNALEVKHELIKLKYKAERNAPNISPDVSQAPTAYPLPSPAPIRSSAQASANDQGAVYPPNAPLRSSGPAPAPVQPVQPPQMPIILSPAPMRPTQAQQQPRMPVGSVPPPGPVQAARFTRPAQSPISAPPERVWTRGFVLIFAVILLLTIGGSWLVFNFYQLFGSSVRLDFVVELVLAVVFTLLALFSIAFVRNVFAITILVVSAIGMAIAVLAFLIQTVLSADSGYQSYILMHHWISSLITAGLAAAAFVSLAWLIFLNRLLDRVVLAGLFGIALVFAVLQIFTSPNDSNGNRAVYLIFCLIALILGVLIAVRTEQVRRPYD